ncbi:hypothetical protein B2J93_6642 [Marssonina coronariae]|uniref:Spermatogenesis-associated protein 20-like TRX domain-containing protein n=1 Tax=Diplocarpon coronariae TaxID=2795749 RepID=A0A218Z3T8_9HELO|nr:hypothetical protein B2J93_6642 [Marssonina coronariae]
MAAQLRGDAEQGRGIGHALKQNGGGAARPVAAAPGRVSEEAPALVLTNRAGESPSPYVRAHAQNPVAWQIWGDEAVGLARRENRLLFVSIGYNACHWCHVMERESFEHDEVAALLNSAFVPIKIDREERPDIERIYMNFVQATTGSGGWPLNVFVTPDLEPVFGGTYWPGPASHAAAGDPVDFLTILAKLSTVWREQEERCRKDSRQILEQLRSFAAEGTGAGRLGEAGDGLDIELLEEARQHLAQTYDAQHGGFSPAPKFPTPSKLSFLLRLGQYPPVVVDVVGAADCRSAQHMAITTLRKMARGGIHDHVGAGFARYSVTADWSRPHFEKMLYDNAQLLHVYLDAFLLSRDAELLGVVYDISTYLTTDLAHPAGGFYASEDADSLYRRGDSETREGAYYVWTKREFESVLGPRAEPLLSAFFNVSDHGNVGREHDAHDEFLDQNVLAIVRTPRALASQFGMAEEEVVRMIKDGKAALRSHRERERVRPGVDDKIVSSWNGIAVGALARTAAVVQGFDPAKSETLLSSALSAATFVRDHLYDGSSKILYRIWREGRGETEGFADDYASLIEGLIDLYEATFDEQWLQWADDLQQTQLSRFFDAAGTGGFFSTPDAAPHTILRLKDGMDTSEPSTNGTSASNLYRLSSLLNDCSYAEKARQTLAGFESEMLQYPWLFASFMPSIVASQLGVRGVVAAGPDVVGRVREFEKRPRGGLGTCAWLRSGDGGWLRRRNELLTHYGADGKARVMVCEGGACQEDVVLGEERAGGGGEREPLGVAELGDALPSPGRDTGPGGGSNGVPAPTSETEEAAAPANAA